MKMKLDGMEMEGTPEEFVQYNKLILGYATKKSKPPTILYVDKPTVTKIKNKKTKNILWKKYLGLSLKDKVKELSNNGNSEPSIVNYLIEKAIPYNDQPKSKIRHRAKVCAHAALIKLRRDIQ